MFLDALVSRLSFLWQLGQVAVLWLCFMPIFLQALQRWLVFLALVLRTRILFLVAVSSIFSCTSPCSHLLFGIQAKFSKIIVALLSSAMFAICSAVCIARSRFSREILLRTLNRSVFSFSALL